MQDQIDLVRDWSAYDEEAALAAGRAYQEAATALDDDPAAAQDILRGFVRRLNALQDADEFLTAAHDSAEEAFFVLAERAGADLDDARAWFDDERDF